MSATRAGRGQGLHAYATVGSYGCRFHNIMRGLQATPAARRPDQPAALSQEAPYARPSSASTSYALVDRQRVETIIIGARSPDKAPRAGGIDDAAHCFAGGHGISTPRRGDRRAVRPTPIRSSQREVRTRAGNHFRRALCCSEPRVPIRRLPHYVLRPAYARLAARVFVLLLPACVYSSVLP
jgi:hypothetical protein